MEIHFEDDFFIPPGFPAFPNYPYYSEGEDIIISNTRTILKVEKQLEILIPDKETIEKI